MPDAEYASLEYVQAGRSAFVGAVGVYLLLHAVSYSHLSSKILHHVERWSTSTPPNGRSGPETTYYPSLVWQRYDRFVSGDCVPSINKVRRPSDVPQASGAETEHFLYWRVDWLNVSYFRRRNVTQRCNCLVEIEVPIIHRDCNFSFC